MKSEVLRPQRGRRTSVHCLRCYTRPYRCSSSMMMVPSTFFSACLPRNSATKGSLMSSSFCRPSSCWWSPAGRGCHSRSPRPRHARSTSSRGVNRLHGGADGVLGGEDGVPHGVGELADEGEVHAALGHHLGRSPAVRGMKKAVMWGIMQGDGAGAVEGPCPQSRSQARPVVEPLHRSSPRRCTPAWAS